MMRMSADIKNKLCFILPPIVVKYTGVLRQNIRFARAKKRLQGCTKLHLGCGGNLFPGWHNIDIDGPKDVIKLDLSRPLPVASGSVRFMFSEHFIEHLTLFQGRRFLNECCRILAPQGVLRISTPSLQAGFEAYKEKRIKGMEYRGWSPATPCQMVNEAMRLWGHQFVYDTEELVGLLKECGFSTVAAVDWHLSQYPELCGLESRPYHGDIILEAQK